MMTIKNKSTKYKIISRELEKAMPENAMVATDIGNICSVSNSYLRYSPFLNSQPFFKHC